MKTLIVFAKAPVAGNVKTRLLESTPLDEGQVLDLYTAFLTDTLTMATLTGAETIAIHYTPATEEKKMRKIVRGLRIGSRNERRFTFAPQEGQTFTDRIAHSFRLAVKQGGGQLAMIGSDSPLIRPQMIDTAFEFIYSRSGMALGPSMEGGVYLIGFNADAPVDFERVFTKGSEIENLVKIAKALNMPLKILPETLDVDVASDLVSLVSIIRALSYERKFTDQVFPVNTGKMIENLKLKIARAPDNSRGKFLEFSDE
ncbi:hypothetical protein MNBD_NITROSPINAE04-2087 [hydrothermal vent metagenome]|uniref:HTH cro/C1-type domain-containing protein n=1 Tax=hydrothermal vent metagenome TaxID=652676 RepID=A0A3B1CHI0_9ZZZZ